MLAIKRSAGVAPQVNLRNPQYTGDEAGKWRIYPGFETQDRHYQESKIEKQVAPQKGLIPIFRYWPPEWDFLLIYFIMISSYSIYELI